MVNKIYSDIDTLHTINPTLLLELVNRFNPYFSKYAVVKNQSEIDYDNLHTALLNLNRPQQEEMPEELLDILHSVSELSAPQHSDEFLDKISQIQPNYVVNNAAHGSIDVALYCRLNFPDLFEKQYALTKLSNQRSFRYFLGKQDEQSRFMPPNDTHITLVQNEIAQWCGNNKRPSFVKVLLQKKSATVYWFIVVHGEPLRREAKISDDNDIKSIYYYPRKTDLIIYDQSKNRLQVKCSGKKLFEKYCELIGIICFQDAKYFKENECPFTLDPLINATQEDYDWCQAPGVESVKLTSVTIMHPGNIEIRKTNGDYYPNLVARNKSSTYKLNITEAKFNIKQVNQKNYRSITIRKDKVIYVRNEDSLALEDWLTQHQFTQ